MKIWFPAAVLLLVAALVVRLRRTYSIVRVDGDSMNPTLVDGDRVLARRVSPSAMRRGQVVVVVNPLPVGERFLIKRIAALPGDPVPPMQGTVLSEERVPSGQLILLGDNADVSFDSRDLGYFPVSEIHAVTIRKLMGTPVKGNK
ncbi:signal peptidase I [Nonomuraea turkmeniaca]|uniref:Signal peptidase I n=1 Tax=Nonomuraea turkmeniaca TaxID=103838 RepID=A0A5S4F8J3_9ACTN|nr:signal peptidase I [Nonomuraea turkmeniaca]TMR12899.1 signal peptidase I [Nonomuraea turkmeniaca]